MADTDITAVIEPAKGPYSLEGLDKQEVYAIGVNDPDFTGIGTVGTHSLVEVAEGLALMSIDIIPLTDAASGGSATVAFRCGGVALAAAIPVADLVVGRVISLPALKDGSSINYSFDEDNIVDVEMVVAVAALTEFKFALRATYHDVKSTIECG